MGFRSLCQWPHTPARVCSARTHRVCSVAFAERSSASRSGGCSWASGSWGLWWGCCPARSCCWGSRRYAPAACTGCLFRPSAKLLKELCPASVLPLAMMVQHTTFLKCANSETLTALQRFDCVPLSSQALGSHQVNAFEICKDCFCKDSCWLPICSIQWHHAECQKDTRVPSDFILHSF